MQIDHAQEQCHRPRCACHVPNGDAYCSEHCRQAAEGASSHAKPASDCACGHDACRDDSGTAGENAV